jgi:hypothetical protein
VLVPTAASAQTAWTIHRLILKFHDGSTFDSATEPGALTLIKNADYRLWEHEGNVLHVSCSEDLDETPGTVVHPDGHTLTITDFYLRSNNPGASDRKPPCGNSELIPDCDPEPDPCPEGTDHAGIPMEDHDDCNEPDEPECPEEGEIGVAQVDDDCPDEEEPELCPDGTDHAGIPMSEVEDCDDPEEEPELCPEGTVNAGTPMDDVDDCDPDPNEVEDLVCPENSDFPGMVTDDLDDCIEVVVLPVVLEDEDDEDDDTEVLGVSQDRRELARTGAGSPEGLALFGLLLLGLGTEVLRRTRTV